MSRSLILLAVSALGVCLSQAQETPATNPSSKPTEHVLGTITAVDSASHTTTIKDDKTGSEVKVSVANTHTLLKVDPAAKDLKNATRITADDLAVGDRVDVRGFKAEDGSSGINARSVILMSARDLAQKHRAEASAWQNSTAGAVTAVGPSSGTININVRTPEGQKPMLVQVSPATYFTRYSTENPKIPAPSRIADINPGDQLRVIGEKNADGTSISAEKVYSGAFRTIAATITSVSADGKQIGVKDLQTKQPVQVAVTGDASLRKLPPMVATGMARRLNPEYRAAGSTPDQASNRTDRPAGADGQRGPGSGMRAGSGDFSRMLERLPPIAISDLKPGDAVIVSGAIPENDNSRLIANSVIAGVEPIFQSAPPRQGQSLGDWSLDMSIPAQ